MKRDARIGMAVVLVLGLSVTALIGRALYKRGGGTGEMEGEVADTSNNSNAEKPADALTLRPRASIRPNDLDGAPDPINAASQATAQTALPPLNPLQAQTSELMRSEFDHETAARSNDALPPRDPAPSAASNETFFAYSAAANESPWKISSKVFGDGKYTQKIVDANGGMDALKLKLKSGGTIKIPHLQDKRMLLNLTTYAEGKPAKATHNERVAAAANVPAHATEHGSSHASGSTYKVLKGETLTSIARKNYGSTSPKTIAMIVAANHGVDANSVKAGQELVLPALK